MKRELFIRLFDEVISFTGICNTTADEELLANNQTELSSISLMANKLRYYLYRCHTIYQKRLNQDVYRRCGKVRIQMCRG